MHAINLFSFPSLKKRGNNAKCLQITFFSRKRGELVCFTGNRARKDARNEEDTINRDPGKKNTFRPLHIDRVGDKREEGHAHRTERFRAREQWREGRGIGFSSGDLAERQRPWHSKRVYPVKPEVVDEETEFNLRIDYSLKLMRYSLKYNYFFN